MRNATGGKRIDSQSRIIGASPRAIYDAFVAVEALVSWLPPKGATGEIHVFEPREGGTFRMTLTFDRDEQSAPGKSSDNTDIVEGRFIELAPGERIVQLIEFVSDHPAFAGTMTMTWKLIPVEYGTKVTILCEDVPHGIRPEDHEAGMASTLANLAFYVE